MTVVASKYERQPNELYRTERWATEAFLQHFPVRGRSVWEPAAGAHDMADVLREYGAAVFTSDIATYGRDHDAEFDFLSDRQDYEVFDDLITNPPYGKGNRMAVRFVEKALHRCSGYVALLLTMKFDSGKTRRHLLGENPRFVAKIVLLDRICWFPGSEDSGTEDHAWFVWGPMPLFPQPPRIIYASKDDVRSVRVAA